MIEILTQPAVLALIGTLFGGIGLKVVEKLLNRSKTQTDLASQIRTELRSDVQALRDEIRKVETELDLWKSKYYELLEEQMKLKARLSICERNQKEEQTPIDENTT